MENKNYGERQEGRNDAERVNLPKGGLERDLYSAKDRYSFYNQLNYGGQDDK